MLAQLLTKQNYRWLAVLLWMAIIFYLSHQQGSESSGLSSGITAAIVDLIHTIFPFIPIELDTFHHLIRKSAHFIAYLILGLLVMHALGRIRLKKAVPALVICILYAASDEFHQLFIPGRSGEIRDVLIDSAGSASGIAIYLMLSFIVDSMIQTKKDSQ